MEKGWSNIREKDFFEKVKLTVNNIHYVMVRDEFKGSFYSYKKKNILVMKVGHILLSKGIVENHGNNMKPVYVWAGRVPDEKMFEEVRDALRYVTPTAKPKKALEANNVVPTIKVVNEMHENPLSELADIQLWNELVNRGYRIEDNRILKTIYLN